MSLACGGCSSQGRATHVLQEGWLFEKGDLEGAEAVDYNDLGWQEVRVPHDWAISGPFNPRENGYAAKLPWKGVGWYRKQFKLSKADQGKRVYFDFDGVMAFPKVYVNGQLAGQWDYGYMSFRVDATDYVKFGRTNVIAVQADTRQHGTRWYPGAGIYRKVTMSVCNPVHIAHWGTFVTTPVVTDLSARIRAYITVENHTDSTQTALVKTIIVDPAGKTVGSMTTSTSLQSGQNKSVMQAIEASNPQRWDVTSPKLYRAKTVVSVDGRTTDVETRRFGIRTFKFTADDGFHLNGRRVQLYGVNLHHGHGPLGAAFYRRAMQRQLEIMREMGVNCIRTSHNPPSPELLDLCDEMGFVVWDEAFDKWHGTADRIDGKPPLEEYGEKQIRNFVMRDRNHPCVVMWSIGNEINNGGEGKSPERVKFMSDFVRDYDPTRPVGMGCHIPSTADQPILDALDMTGWNYARRYARFRERYPDKPIVYSESASALSTRGFYELPLPNGKTDYSQQLQVDSYDLNAAAWSDIADKEFQLMEDDKFVAGEMVWTGFDYLGEPTPFNQQARSSYFGIVDLCGIPKDRFYLYRSYWRPDVTTVHILPHWNWPDRVGQNVPVFVYTNGDSAELFLNGKSLGRRTKGEIPEKPANLAQGKKATAGSEETDKENVAANATDADNSTRWCAAAESPDQWWQVDLGQAQPIGYLDIEFEKESKNYGYEIKASDDASTWRTIATKPTSNSPRWGGPTGRSHEVDAKARYVRIEFKDLRRGAWASFKEFGVYAEKVESSYYDPTYKYRLRWNDVTYEPGELKAVAYRDGKRIGQAVMRTAGEPAAIRLTPDVTELTAGGLDLCYVLVEALDEGGNLCPLADDMIHFELDGPAEIAGVGNGNPLSFEPFQADYRKLFYGKAMVILRTQKGKPGRITLRAMADGLTSAETSLRAR